MEHNQLVTSHHKELWDGQPQLSSLGSLCVGQAREPWSGPARWPRVLRFKLMHYPKSECRECPLSLSPNDLGSVLAVKG